jgi:hypothetical protein
MRVSGGQSTRSRGQAESPSLDLLIGHHLSGGLRRSSSESSAATARRCNRQRESARKTMGASEGVRPVGLTEPPGQVQPGRLAPIGGPSPTSGPGLAESERREGEVFNLNLKIEIGIKERGF